MTWDEYAEGWEDSDAVLAYSRAAFGGLQRIATERGIELRDARVLDFGCGTGLLTEKLVAEGAHVVALDTSGAMLRVLEEKIARLALPGVSVVSKPIEAARAESPTLFGTPFDVVLASSVCAFVDDYAATVATLVELLRPGGLFMQWDWELSPEDEEPFGLTRDEIDEVLRAARLSDVRVETAFEVEAEGQVMKPLLGCGTAPV